MLFNYESELYPVGCERIDFDWYKTELLSLPTAELQEKHAEYTRVLEELRKKEPARKRSKKGEYRLWITRTHDLNELINAIIQELQSR